MTKNIDYTAQEKLAINNARILLKRSMQDDTPIEVFNLALANFNDITLVAYNARLMRNTKRRNPIRRLFKK